MATENQSLWKINTLERQHIQEAVQLHLQAFPSFFLSFLGAGFLKEFYGAFLKNRAALAFVCEDAQGNVRGVIVGTMNPEGFFRRLLLRRWWAFAIASIVALVRKPSVAPRLLRAVKYRGDAPTDMSRALLSSITVNPNWQNRGIGGKLLSHWLNEIRKRNCAGCYLTTDATGNEAVNAFYEKQGWKLQARYVTSEGRLMNRYIVDVRTLE